MAIRFSEFNSTRLTSSSVRLNLGTACAKAANTACLTVFWMRTPDQLFDQNADHVILTRDSGTASGNGGLLFINRAGTSLTFKMFAGGNAAGNVTLTGLSLSTDYCVMLSCRDGYNHLVACPVGGGATLSAQQISTRPFQTTWSGSRFWENIGGAPLGNGRAWFGQIEDFNFYLGALPESSAGVLDDTVVQAIANGTQDLNTLASILNQDGSSTPLRHRVRYRMRHEGDLADAKADPATPVVAAMIPTNLNAASGAALYASGPIIPGAVVPARTRDCISQVIFATPGDAATATAQVKVEGGTYSGLPTIAKMQVRLLDESRAVVADWIDLTTSAPVGGAGTWSASDGFPSVPMQASYLTRQFRAVDSGGAVLAEACGYGLSGAGFHLNTQAQSQLMYLFQNGGFSTLPSGTRAVTLQQEANGLTAPPSRYMLLGSGIPNIYGIKRGIAQFITEINARFPGIPIQIDTFGSAGTPITDYIGTGPYAGRPARMKANLGLVQPYYMLFLGHSQDCGPTYGAELTELIALTEADLGPPIKHLHVPVPRYSLAGSDEDLGGAAALKYSRIGSRSVCLADPDRNLWMGSWSTVFTSENTVAGDPHPADSNTGQGRTGGMMAWALMSACRAIEDVPLTISAIRKEGSGKMVIEFGPVNA